MRAYAKAMAKANQIMLDMTKENPIGKEIEFHLIVTGEYLF